jgi:hypothetical protein
MLGIFCKKRAPKVLNQTYINTVQTAKEREELIIKENKETIQKMEELKQYAMEAGCTDALKFIKDFEKDKYNEIKQSLEKIKKFNINIKPN